MTDSSIYVGLGIQALLLAAAWGDMRRQVRENRERQDERHQENRETLGEIRHDVKRINGSVAKHEVRLDVIDRRYDD